MTKELEVNSLEYLYADEIKFFPKHTYNQCFSGEISDEIKKWQPIPISL